MYVSLPEEISTTGKLNWDLADKLYYGHGKIVTMPTGGKLFFNDRFFVLFWRQCLVNFVEDSVKQILLKTVFSEFCRRQHLASFVEDSV